MLLICCFLIERLLTFTLECFPWLSCYVNLCFCLPQRLLGHSSSAVMWQPWCLFKKDKINWVNINRPFPLYKLCRIDKCQQTFELFALSCAFGKCSHTQTHLDPVTCHLKVNSKGSRRASSHASSPLPKPCLCVWPVKPRVTEKWCEPWLLSGCSARESIHWLALCSGCHSLTLSICHSKGEQKSLNKTAAAQCFLST